MKGSILLAMLLFGSHALAGEFLVKYKNDAGFQYLQNVGVGKSVSITVMDHHDVANLVKVFIPKNLEARTLATLLKQEGIEYAVPNFKLKAFSAPVDMNALRTQWAIQKVQAQKAWDRAGNKGSKNVIVAVMDTGADYNHQALAPNMVAGYNFKIGRAHV